MLLPSGPLEWCAVTVEAENVGLASAMARTALNFGNRLHAVVDVKFPENLVQVVFYSIRTDAQNAAYLGIGFAFPHPTHYFGLALAESVNFVPGCVSLERESARRLRQERYSTQCCIKVGQQ